MIKMVKDEERKSEEEQSKNPAEGEFHIEDMELFLRAYNLFVEKVVEFEWPEGHEICSDPQMMRMVFQMYWKQRHRQRLEDERMQKKRSRQGRDQNESTEFMIGGKENFKKFLRGYFESHSDEDEHEDETVFIDPGESEPDEAPSTEDAKIRQQRFREEWE